MRPICLEPRPLMTDSNLDMKSTSFGCAHALVVRWNPGTCVRQNAQTIAEIPPMPGNVLAGHNGGVCLIGFHYRPGDPVPLMVAGNRDEYYDRPTAPLAWWEGGRILAGQDLWSGGTWMGVSRDGRFAAITNFREPLRSKKDAPSRGFIPLRFLEEGGNALDFLNWLRKEASRYALFDALVYDGVELLGYESRHERHVSFAPGIHAVSNGDFDEPWPKVMALKAGMAAGPDDDERLLTLLGDARRYADDRLPSTGVSIEWERVLSPAFVRTPTYGTRTSMIVRLGPKHVSTLEQRFGAGGREGGRSEFQFLTG
jgi:uncharacterized protein with NRDE domain